jgi:hypothetical protein
MDGKKWLGALVLSIGAVVAGSQVMAEDRAAPPQEETDVPPCYQGYSRDGKEYRQRWQAFADRRAEALHTALRLDAEQETAWQTYRQSFSEIFTSHWKERRGEYRDWDKFAELSAPERLEKQISWSKERNERLTAHLASLKTFYKTLTPEQKKIFDQYSWRDAGPGGWHRGGGPGWGHRGGWHHGGGPGWGHRGGPGGYAPCS